MKKNYGFTVIELIIAMSVIALLAAFSTAGYSNYKRKASIRNIWGEMTTMAVYVNQAYVDSGVSTCPQDTPIGSGIVVNNNDWQVVCTSSGGFNFTLTSTGKGLMSGYAYTLAQSNTKKTTSHPSGANDTCWSIAGGANCDE